ncbi:MAG: amidase [Acidobacteriota bacterium]
MERRAFIEAGVVAATAAGLSSSALGEGAPPAPQPPQGVVVSPFEIEEMGLAALRAAIDRGRFSARRLCELYLARIDAIDRSALHAVIEVNPDALAIAEELDRRPAAGRGSLHGIPILVKDNIDTADRMATSAGSLALAAGHAPRDAFVVTRLRDAGAVILGKTNLSEWANFRGSPSLSGWSGRGGQTRNPYALDRNPCGSSSGSGVAVSANLAAAAVGTETDGSIVCPCGINGVVGIKPTLGMVSRSGIIPIAHSQDTAGPMARTVADAALLLEAMAVADPGDAITTSARVPSVRDLDPRRIKGARIGIVRHYFGGSPAVDGVMEEAIAALKSAGAEIVDPVVLPHVGEYDEAELEVLLYEFKADLNAYLGARGVEGAKSLEELIRFNEANRDRELSVFGQELFLKAQAKGPLTEKPYLDALAKSKRFAGAEGIDAAVKAHRCAALLAPTNGPAWLTGRRQRRSPRHHRLLIGGGGRGTPHVTVPAGPVRGLPIGLSLFGPAWSEPTLLSLALAFEQETRARRPPKLLPYVGS